MKYEKLLMPRQLSLRFCCHSRPAHSDLKFANVQFLDSPAHSALKFANVQFLEFALLVYTQRLKSRFLNTFSEQSSPKCACAED